MIIIYLIINGFTTYLPPPSREIVLNRPLSSKSIQTIQVYYTLTLDSCCPSAYNCTDVVYEVHDAKNQLVAHVTKHWGGGAETCKGKFKNTWLRQNCSQTFFSMLFGMLQC